jgi:chemotaxis protein histidine kinase CheA
MNNLHKDFLRRSVAALENLTESAQETEALSPDFLREAFRTVHTIKGTAQTFGFPAPARAAHELENLLAGAKKDSSELKTAVLDGLALLLKSFDEPEIVSHQEIPAATGGSAGDVSAAKDFSAQIPAAIAGQLSDFEKRIFASAVSDGKNVFRIKAVFEMAEFAGGFKRLKDELSAKGEIIATLPDRDLSDRSKIGFLIFLATVEDEKTFCGCPAEIIGPDDLSDRLNGVLSQIAAHAKVLARELGKKIEVTISAVKIELPADKLMLIFDALLHLARNAVDHAIEPAAERIARGKGAAGKIKISVEIAGDGLRIFVTDDGKGIDADEIKAKAIEKNLLSPEKVLTEAELLDLIFLPEFSTRETVSEVSGRGVGLDAVKNLIENAGGRISVKSLRNAGTTFEIFLPEIF